MTSFGYSFKNNTVQKSIKLTTFLYQSQCESIKITIFTAIFPTWLVFISIFLLSIDQKTIWLWYKKNLQAILVLMMPNSTRYVQDVTYARHFLKPADRVFQNGGSETRVSDGFRGCRTRAHTNSKHCTQTQKRWKQTLEGLFYSRHLFYYNIEAVRSRNVELDWADFSSGGGLMVDDI